MSGGGPLARRAQQRDLALERANEIKAQNATLRRELRRGRVDVYALIEGTVEAHEATAARMKLRLLLKAIPGVGPVMVHEVLTAVGYSPERRLGQLTYEERATLATTLRGARGAV